MLAPPGSSTPIHDKHQGAPSMSTEAQLARQALQESMDLREQGHSDD